MSPSRADLKENEDASSSASSLAAEENATMEDAQREPVEAEVEGDVEMEDGEEDEDEEEEYVQRIRLLPGSTEHAASFEILHEGHTLGNVLRYIIIKNPDVEFCAYDIPHPSEPKMNLRIQTFETTTATEALQKGLKDLEESCDVIAEKFTKAREDFSGTA
ncbi:uncharacterized protein MKZ38_003403 [Zalerion maritima]|uniref:DNA-directed RNA polymerase RBP11-like dimerisation domain-containing protein n=1 Tax=Zalerion maritima TaxID=339359 RepID=A0AAD5RP75_9PEZI|nr:uncharacterized protein MKZ38_003403 [Zalerion maritima]